MFSFAGKFVKLNVAVSLLYDIKLEYIVCYTWLYYLIIPTALKPIQPRIEETSSSGHPDGFFEWICSRSDCNDSRLPGFRATRRKPPDSAAPLFDDFAVDDYGPRQRWQSYHSKQWLPKPSSNYLSIYLPIYLPTYLPIYLSTHIHIHTSAIDPDPIFGPEVKVSSKPLKAKPQDLKTDGPKGRNSQIQSPIFVTYTILGVPYYFLRSNGHQNPILILEAPILNAYGSPYRPLPLKGTPGPSCH